MRFASAPFSERSLSGPWVFVQELELRRCQAQEEQLRMEAGIGRPTDTEWQGPAGAQVCEHQLSRAQMEQDDFCLCRGGLFESPCSAVRYCAVVNAHKQHSDFISSSVCGIPTDSHSTKRCSCQFSLSAIKTGRECRSSLLAVVRRADTATVPPPPPTRSLKQTVQDCLAVQGNANSACHQTLSSGASTSKHRERHRRGVKLRHLLWGHASCEDSAERLQRLTVREALVSLGLSYSGLGMFWLGRLGPWVFVQELELRRCQAQEEQLRMEAGIGRPTDTEWQGPAGAQVCEHQLSRGADGAGRFLPLSWWSV